MAKFAQWYQVDFTEWDEWQLAMAVGNEGEGRIIRAGEKNQSRALISSEANVQSTAVAVWSMALYIHFSSYWHRRVGYVNVASPLPCLRDTIAFT